MDNQVKRPRVLLVEDCPDTRTIYRVYLQFSGFDVVEAANGLEGLHHAIEASPDIILMDLSLPVMDGWEAVRLLRADGRTSGILIMLLTCSTREEIAERAQKAGCDAVVSKPRKPSDLVNDVRKVLRSVRHEQLADGSDPSASVSINRLSPFVARP
jgi:two-component system cell cycle response regulator DivK